MHFHSPTSAIPSAVIIDALKIIAFLSLALKGVKYRADPADRLLSLVYGLGGVIAPFISIKLIDVVLTPFM